jgi:hypothetical protein
MTTRLPTIALLCMTACTLGKPGTIGELTEDADTGDATDDPTTGATGIDDPATTDPTTGDPPDTEDTGPSATPTAVDVLFVIDNSGSMADVQQSIASSIGAFVDPITGAGLDLRIAVTTTDIGNPRCVGTTPEDGALSVTSCRERVAAGEFATPEGDFTSACLDACAHDSIATLPTATAEDPDLAPRPWIEWSAGTTNLDIPLGEALSCALPQGITGCGFESQLEAMNRSLGRMHSPGDPAFGFLRPEAHLVIILVTDEMDCSANPDFDEIFVDNTQFWWDPANDVAPTSSLCWTAGVTCSGGPGTYDDCVATDHAIDGSVTTDPSAAVLHPVSRYHAILDAQQAEKLAAGAGGQVQLVVIGGVPINYPDNPLVFADADADTMSKFGIGPGCNNGEKIAVPPARLREVVAGHTPLVKGLFSICQPNLSGPLSVIAAGITAN